MPYPLKGTAMSHTPSIFQRKAVIVETPFQSRVPVVGPLLARARSAWNNVAARWYVQALFQQQIEFNLAVANALDDNAERFVETDRDQAALLRQMAELTVQVKQLRTRVDDLERQLAAR
jgi:hypothetical protein